MNEPDNFPFHWVRYLDNDELDKLVGVASFELEVRKRGAPQTCPRHVGNRWCKLIAGHEAQCDFPTIEEHAEEIREMVRRVVEEEDAIRLEVARRAEELSR